MSSKNWISDIELLNEYVLNSLSIKQICKKYACNRKRMTRILKANNINTQVNGYRIRAENQTNIPQIRRVKSANTLKCIPEKLWGYIAGIFDGEGCLLRTVTKPNLYISYRVIISQNDTILHNWLISNLGGGHIKPTDKPNHFQWTLNYQAQIYSFLKNIEPFSLIKKHKIIKALKELNEKYKFE